MVPASVAPGVSVGRDDARHRCGDGGPLVWIEEVAHRVSFLSAVLFWVLSTRCIWV